MNIKTKNKDEELKEVRKIIMFICIVVMCMACLLGGCEYINKNVLKVEDDWYGEEIFETVVNEAGEMYLKKLTGAEVDLDFDFSPSSPEN